MAYCVVLRTERSLVQILLWTCFFKKACTMEIVHFRQFSPTINSITQDRGGTRSEYWGFDMMINSKLPILRHLLK